MNDLPKQYRCRECENVSFILEKCHTQQMVETCHCGSGKFPEECHPDGPPKLNNEFHFT